jgi:hypothetical protein
VEDWIFAENVQPFVELLAFLAGYMLYDDAYDWVAIEHGINASFLKPGRCSDISDAAGAWAGVIGTPTSDEPQTISEGAQR